METELSRPWIVIGWLLRNTFAAIPWLRSWATFAISTGIVWSFTAHRLLMVDEIVLRSILVAEALVLLTVVVFLVDATGALCQFMWANYKGSVIWIIAGPALLLFLALLIPYVWFAVWILRKTWSWWNAVLASLGWHVAIPMIPPHWLVWGGLFFVHAAFAYLMLSGRWIGWNYAYRDSLRILGIRRFLAGIFLMMYLRLLVPRRDFFLQAPVVSWMPTLAIAAVLSVVVPMHVFAITTPIIFLMLMFPFKSSSVAPPLWIFFAGSGFDSFELFHRLRNTWRKHGLNLLKRTSTGGVNFYAAWRSKMNRAVPFYDPSIGRVWSLRTRTPLWQTAVRLLASFVPVVIVDLTSPATSNVEFEMEWLRQHGLLHKTFVVTSPESDASATSAYSDWDLHIVDQEKLLDAEWTRAGLKL